LTNFTLTLRNDDVLIDSRDWNDPFGRWKHDHEWCLFAKPKIQHMAAFLIKGLEDRYKQHIPYFREQIQEGNLIGELHGYEHIDFKPLSKNNIKEILKYCKDFMERELGCVPSKLLTPWGANAPHIAEACLEEDMVMVDCSNVYDLRRVIASIREKNTPIERFSDKDILWHYWHRGNRVARLALVAKYGTWEAAKNERPELFK